MSVSLDRGTTIGRLRLRAATADPHALRMRGGTAVGALDLQPPAMPEQAILCIRSLNDPQPGGLDLRFSAAPRPVAWETAMRGAVAGALRRAVRPALGPVPAAADAVLFADRSELLACAARDAVRGNLTINWWWTHLLGGERSPAAVAREWTRAPAYVPGAVEWLSTRNEIAGFVRTLAPAEAVRLLDAVLRVHALPALASSVVQALTASLDPPMAPPTPELRHAIRPEVRPRVEPPSPPPWRAMVPNLSPAALTVEQSTFVAVVLALRRSPALTRSERFAEEAAAWIESERRRDVPVTIRPIETERSGPLSVASIQEEPGKSQAAPEAGPELQAAELQQPAAHRLEPRGSEQTIDTFREQKIDSSTAPRLDIKSEIPSLEHRPERSAILEEPPAPDATPGLEIVEKSADPEAAEPPPRPDLAIDTDFAGVFFLLNVGIALGLYSDFTSPVQQGIELDVWDFLALTGPALAEIDGFGDDPIGPFLAALANRKEDEPPGGGGFVPPAGRSLSPWLDATISRIRERLALAGLEEPSRIVRRYGRVTTTPAHLDVCFSLAAHPIEIRLAGLDRNPGWIPAAGRHVAFHFD